MAERRMFAKSVINSARFLTMTPSSRLLYYDLGMAADDDGVVEAFKAASEFVNGIVPPKTEKAVPADQSAEAPAVPEN